MQIDVYIHLQQNDSKLDTILTKLTQLANLQQQEVVKMAAIDDKVAALQQQVAAENSVVDSAETLLTNLSQMLKDALAGGVSQATLDAVDAIATSVSAKSSELAAAVTANTPAA